MRVLIAGGGTGGHVLPAIAVAEEFIRKGAEVVFVGTRDGLEAEIVTKKRWKIEYLSSRQFKGQNLLKRFFALLKIMSSVFVAMKIISRQKPDLVIGVGGYVSVPTLIAAKIKFLPVAIMEQNSIPGVANRILGRIAKLIFLTYPGSEEYFNSKKVLVSGNPVRKEIVATPKRLPPFNGKFVVFCFGGSQGAKSLNEAMLSSLRYLLDQKGSLKIIHQVGSTVDVALVRDIYEREGFEAEVYRFIDDIAGCYSRSHLVICRAGATSIAELTVAGRPAVLVPYPYAADNHQEGNAKFIAENGGAVLVQNKDLTGEKVASVIKVFMRDSETLTKMSSAMLDIARPYAASVIVEKCLKLVS